MGVPNASKWFRNAFTGDPSNWHKANSLAIAFGDDELVHDIPIACMFEWVRPWKQFVSGRRMLARNAGFPA